MTKPTMTAPKRQLPGGELGVLAVPYDGNGLEVPAEAGAQLLGHRKVKAVVAAVGGDEAERRELGVEADDELLLFSGLCGVRRVGAGLGGIVLLGAAGDEGQAQHEGERKRDELFHGLDSSAFRFSVML